MILTWGGTVEEVTTFETSCQWCHKVFELTVPKKGLEAYRKGALMQNAFPNLNKEEKELLISRTCGKCFDKICGSF